MHCTAFTSFPKPLALIVACDTAIFHHLGDYDGVMTQQSSFLCATGSQQNPTPIK
ncbi:hypothetical protein A0R60_0395 [Enterobacter asburiae]|nr:hypothetical protein A0R60_0395 [Enterobacter asburiae]